jgi:hypothetical protein
MDREKNAESEFTPSDESETEQANIRMDREFNVDTDVKHPEETTVPFIYNNQS